MRDWRTSLPSTLLNNMVYRTFLISPYKSVSFTGYFTLVARCPFTYNGGERGDDDCMRQILVVDDEPSVLHILHRGLTLKGFTVRDATNGEEAFHQLASHFPDLLLLDVMLPDKDGFTLCRMIREEGYTTLPILLLTAKDDVHDKIIGLDEGADDYITKPFDFEELIAHIRAALQRSEGVSHFPEKLCIGDLFLDTQRRQVWRGAKAIELTKREYEVLELLAQNAGRVLTKERIFERVWGYNNDTSLEVIKVYINYLRAKLNEGGLPNLIHVVRGVGYMLKGEASINERPK